MKFIPGSWLAVLGGGQLGRMFCQSAQAMGYRVMVLDPDVASPAGRVADFHLQAAYDDIGALQQIAAKCVAVTTEFENVPAGSLHFLANSILVTPSGDCVAAAQDRLVEKECIQKAGVAVADHAAILSESDLDGCADNLFPGILKTTRFGYDGKGQIRVDNKSEARQAFLDLQSVPCILEALQDLDYEISVVLARDINNQVMCFEPARNLHRDGILDVSIVDGSLDQNIINQAQQYAIQLAEYLNYQGILCVEFFVLQNGRIIANEMAPRPHNSGHYTQNACQTSQFEQQARIMAGLPLGDTRVLRPTAMLNLLGDLWFINGGLHEPDWSAVLEIAGTSLHLYGKEEPRLGRKMGHINILADDAQQLQKSLKSVRSVLGLNHG